MDTMLERMPMVGDVVKIKIISKDSLITGVITKIGPLGICIEPKLGGDGFVFVKYGDIQLF